MSRPARAPLAGLLAALFVSSPPARAADPSPSGTRLLSAMAVRAVPVGLKLNLVGGYRLGLFDADSVLLRGTYAEAGVFTETSPSNFWVGPYVELVPVAVLQLWVSAQSLSYYGSFGYLHVPPNAAEPDWSLETIRDFEAGDGRSAHGWMVDARATPRAKVGNVVFLAETQLVRVAMDVDRPYYESTFDFLLEPTDTFWVTRPTLGWVFVMDESYVLTAFRWEHGETLGTGFSRDMAALLALWKTPWSPSGGEMKLAVVGGWWVDHPNRADTAYAATQLSIDWAP